MAVRACVIEGKGECNPVKLAEYQHIMRSLWDEISDLADFDKVSVQYFFVSNVFVQIFVYCIL
jgi:hypothetical protein